ncbi:nucleotidyltransferase family protein [Halomonas sp. EGI 63088]|uniref:Nucleotidyltransferase family protein n=1 Tax=Halomonas flagellata TaxID=2920385 RepID=A0ABS9RZQ1_9GAMM|nr:nucleotidyltransferase family protein [Halomonas flagellata]MCH4565333.1 nucleotidyltransferase family protein [Halomonas flagellata]
MAAGHSRRYGAADKRIARLPDGRRLLAATVTRAQEAFPLLRVVLREEDDPAALGLPRETPIIRAPRAERGLGASLADAIAAIAGDDALADTEAAAILLGDMPDIRLDTLQALQRLATRSGIVRPCHAGRPGHPVLFGRDFWPELAALDGDDGARDVIRRHRDGYREIAVEDPGVCRDIDVPAELAPYPDEAPPS